MPVRVTACLALLGSVTFAGSAAGAAADPGPSIRKDPSAPRVAGSAARSGLLPQVSVRHKDGSIKVIKTGSVDAARGLAARLPREDRTVAQAAVSARRYALAEDWEIDQTYLNLVSVRDAWGMDPAQEGDGLKVAIVDGGIDAGHLDFTNTDNSPQIVASANFTGASGTLPKGWHGTHIAGLVAASRNTNGIVGLAPKAQLLDVRVLDQNGEGSSANVADGINWAVANGAKIIVLALGGTADSVEHAAVAAASTAGVLVIAAGGNEFEEGNAASYPAAYSESLAVAAVDDALNHAWFSNTGSYIDISAPGVAILSDLPGDSTAPAGLVGEADGTSMATPIVAGVAAGYWGANPALTAAQVRAKLLAGAQDLGAPGWDPVFGAGLVKPPLGRPLDSVSLTGVSGTTSGRSVTYTAHVEDLGAPRPGVFVELRRKLAGRTTWSTVLTGVTNSSGNVLLSTPVVTSAQYTAVTRRSKTWFSTADLTPVSTLVQGAVSIKSAASGSNVILYGSVAPAVAGKVRVQRWYSSTRTWRDVTTATVRTDGRWSVALPAGTKATNMRAFLNSAPGTFPAWIGGPSPILLVNLA